MTTPDTALDDRYAHHEEPQFFVFVKIPVGRRDMDPLHRRENYLDSVLRDHGVGSVVGWGDSLGERRLNGARVAAHVRVDVTLADLQRGLALLREMLLKLESPADTEIHYASEGRHVVERLDADSGWLAARPAAR
ncbi:MAG: hypothetical protein QM740_04350 [Acidovorax sp.]